MTREAELPDGRILEFPDETTDEVVQRTVKRVLGVPETKPSIVNQALNEVAGVGAFAGDVVGALPGIVGGLPHAVAGMATGKDTPTQALEGVMGAGEALNPMQLYPDQDTLTTARQSESHQFLSRFLHNIFQGIGNVAGAARYHGGQLLGEDEAASNLAAGELGAGAQIATLMAPAAGLMRPRPVEPARAPSPKVQEQIRETYKIEVDPQAKVDATIGKKPAKPVPAEDVALQQQLEEAARTFQKEPLSQRETVQKAFEDAISKARQGDQAAPAGDVPLQKTAPIPTTRQQVTEGFERALPPARETGAIGHLDRVTALERDPQRYQEELRDAQRREEKDTVKYFKEAIEEVTEKIADLQAKYEEQPQGDLLKGPGRRQAGMFEPSAFRLRRQQGDKKTEFEREENLPAGAGLALPDTKGPVLDRVVEAFAIGEDLNRKRGTSQKVELPNDLGSFLGKYGLTSEHVSKFYYDNPLVKTIIDRYKEIDQKYGNLTEDLMKGAELAGKGAITALRYTKRTVSGFTSIADRLGKNDLESLYKAWLQFDNAKVLRDNKLEYPTREMLIEAGYNAKVADAYLAEAQYMKAVYTLINHARQFSGKDPIQFLPGHFPHTYKGNVGIKILRRVQDEAGNPKDVTVGYTRTSGSQKAIDKVIRDLMNDIYKQLDEGGQKNVNLRAEQVRTDKPGNMSDVMDAFESVAEVYSSAKHPLTKLVKKVLDNRISSMEQQFLASSLHRSGLKGWLGYTGVTAKNLRDLQLARTNYITNAIKYARSQEMLNVLNQIPANVWAEITKRLPNTADYLELFTEVARERVPLSRGDQFVLDALDSVFGPRFGYRAPIQGLHKLRGFYSVMDLGWMISYHLANFTQPTMYAPAVLLRESARMGNKGDVAWSVMKGELEFFNPSLETKRAMEYAAKHKYITPKLFEEIDFMYRESQNKLKGFANEMITGRRGSELNEVTGRGRTYLQAYYFYKSAGFTPHQAMRAAGKIVDDVMVDYSRTGQNLWLSHNPLGQVAGKLVAPYAQFQFSHWGNIALTLQSIKKNPANAKAWLPFIELQAAGLILAGVRGITGFAQLAGMWTALNMAYEWATGEKSQWPDLRTVLVKAGLNDFMMFGAGSSATKLIPGLEHGADIGSSVAAPELRGLVNFRQVKGAMDLITDTFGGVAKILMNKELTDSEKYKALKAITPSRFHGFLEVAFQQSDRVAANPENRMRGSVRRSEADRRAREWTNRRSLQEEREAIVSYDLQTEQRSRNEIKGDLVELAVDQLNRRGEIDPDLMRKAMEAGYKPKDFRDRVRTLLQERQRSRIEKMLRGKEATRNRMIQRRRFEELRDDLEAYQEYR